MRKRTRIVVVAVAALLAIPMVAIAADRFNDVPDTNIFHDDIAWLADAGVTAGCNPPANDEFCPEDAVKRQQMAAFMRRFAQYLGAEDGIVSEADNAATAGDADTLDDYKAVEYSSGCTAQWDSRRLSPLRDGPIVRGRHGPCGRRSRDERYGGFLPGTGTVWWHSTWMAPAPSYRECGEASSTMHRTPKRIV